MTVHTCQTSAQAGFEPRLQGPAWFSTVISDAFHSRCCRARSIACLQIVQDRGLACAGAATREIAWQDRWAISGARFVRLNGSSIDRSCCPYEPSRRTEYDRPAAWPGYSPGVGQCPARPRYFVSVHWQRKSLVKICRDCGLKLEPMLGHVSPHREWCRLRELLCGTGGRRRAVAFGRPNPGRPR